MWIVGYGKNLSIPSKGIASDTWGKVSATKFRNTVSDSKIVTPATVDILFLQILFSNFRWQ